MKLALAALIVLVATPVALSDDGHVRRSTLTALGLGRMDEMSDDEGQEVRGRLMSSSFVIGTTFFSYRINDPSGVKEDSVIKMDMHPTTVNLKANFDGLTVNQPNFSASLSAFSIRSFGMVWFTP